MLGGMHRGRHRIHRRASSSDDGDDDELGFGEEVPFVSMDAGSILALARQVLGAPDGVFFAPQIPHRKEKNVREVHASWLPESEPLLVLFDDTLFGAGDDGFAITPVRLVWRNFSEERHQLPWTHVLSLDDEPVAVNGLPIKSTSGKGGILSLSVRLFRSLAMSSRATYGGAPLGASAGVEPCARCGAGPSGSGPFCTQCGGPRRGAF